MTENAPAQVGKTAVATTEEPSIGQLIAEATRDISTLVQNEITLAKSELKLSVKAGGTGIGLFAGAGFILLLSVVMFSFGLAFLISMTGLHLAWSFFLVFALYVSAAAGLGYPPPPPPAPAPPPPPPRGGGGWGAPPPPPPRNSRDHGA